MVDEKEPPVDKENDKSVKRATGVGKIEEHTRIWPVAPYVAVGA